MTKRNEIQAPPFRTVIVKKRKINSERLALGNRVKEIRWLRDISGKDIALYLNLSLNGYYCREYGRIKIGTHECLFPYL